MLDDAKSLGFEETIMHIGNGTLFPCF